MPPETNSGGWNEWSKHVLLEMTRHNDCIEAHIKALAKLDKRLTILEVRCGIFGVIGGSIPALILYFSTKGH